MQPHNGPDHSAPSSRSSMVPSPWFDYANLSVPDNHEDVLKWARYFWVADGNYRTAMERVASHFLTTIDFPDLDPDDEGDWRALFERHINYRREFKAVAEDFLCYNNATVSLYLPFRRFLVCPDCWTSQPIDKIDYKLSLEQSAEKPLKWTRSSGNCPVCGSAEPMTCVDRRDSDLSRVKIIRYAPQELEIAQNRFSKRKVLRWKIPRSVIADVTSGVRIAIDDTPVEVLESIAQSRNFEFNPKMVLHLADPMISGLYDNGWGIPRCISNFRAAWLQQLEHKTDQTTAIDYTLGMRLLSPSPTIGGQDPMVNNGMQEFGKRMQQIISEHRRNPATYHATPYPVEYKFAGGEGRDLMAVEKMKFRQQEYLNQMGVPVEWHQMNLSTQAAPMSLRLFESFWHGIPALYNDLIDWVVDLISTTQGMASTRALMERSTVADDIERKNVLLQLMSANQLSPQTALKPYGVNAHEEVKNLFKYEDYVARLQQENDEKAMKREEMGVTKQMTSGPTPTSMMEEQMMQQEQAAGGMPVGAAGGAPMGGLPGMDQQPRSLSAISEQAQMIAEQLVRMDEHARQGELKALREGKKDLHSLVVQKMEEIRQSARSEGGQMLLQGGM